jgi:deoxyribose-phosphate aldolase
MVKETLGDAWLTPRLFRFGASSLVDDLLRQIVFKETGRYPARHDFASA